MRVNNVDNVVRRMIITVTGNSTGVPCHASRAIHGIDVTSLSCADDNIGNHNNDCYCAALLHWP